MKNNIALKICLFSLIPCMVMTGLIYSYNLNNFNYWSELKAKVIHIERIRNAKLSKAGSLISIGFETIPKIGSIEKSIIVSKTYQFSSPERSLFFENTRTNQIIPIWINKKNNEMDITKPIPPDIVFTFLILCSTLGLFLALVGARLFGEIVIKNGRKK